MGSDGEAMSIGNLITFQLYWNMMNNAFISLGNVFNDLIRASSAAERVLSLIDARPDVKVCLFGCFPNYSDVI